MRVRSIGISMRFVSEEKQKGKESGVEEVCSYLTSVKTYDHLNFHRLMWLNVRFDGSFSF